MTGRERIKRTLQFQHPPYLPHSFGVHLPGLYEQNVEKAARIEAFFGKYPHDLVVWLMPWQQEDVKKDGVVCRTDEWGTQFRDDGHGMYTTYHPLEAGYGQMDRAVFPDAGLPGRLDKAAALFAANPDHYSVGGVWFTLFERLWMLRGFDNALTDIYLEPERFFALKEKIMDVNMGMIDKWLEIGVDSVFFSDDWGGQKNLLINPDDWRKYFRQDYRRMFDRVRSAGKHVFMHLCGNIISILPDLVDLGLDLLNPVQPQALDMELLSREYRGHVCFNGGIDVQGVLVNGTPAEVRAAVHRTVALLSTPAGGYIANTSHSIMPETPLDNIIAMLEAYEEYRK
jgi:uroporphyrinogen decarboxylase